MNYLKTPMRVLLSVMINFVIYVLLLLAALNAKMDIIFQQPRELACLHVMCNIANSAIFHQHVQDARLAMRLILQRLNAQQYVVILLVKYALFLLIVILAHQVLYQ